jgi:hypothetical protein
VRGRDPHPLDLGRPVAVELERAAPDGLAVPGGDQQQARGRGQLIVVGRDAPAGVETAVEAAGQFAEVGPQAGAGVRAPGVAPGDPDRRGHQQPLDLSHRRDEPGALPGAQRPQDGHGRVVGAPVEHSPLGQPRRGEARDAHPPVGLARLHDHEPVLLQRPQQPAQVARVQVQPRSQPPDVAAVRPDLPQQARLAEGAVAGQERVVQRADPLRDGPVEAPDLVDHGRVHSLTYIRDIRRSGGGVPAAAGPGRGGRGRPRLLCCSLDEGWRHAVDRWLSGFFWPG